MSKNITIKQYDGTNYDVLYPSTTASQTSYDNSTTHSSATTVQGVVDELFTSVSNGKKLIASAITGKGQSTSASDTFSTMATNISKIQTGITPSGNKSITATTSTQNNIDVTTYATVSVAPTPTQTKTATTNGTVYPDSGKYLKSVKVSIPVYDGSIYIPTFNEASWSYIKSATVSGKASSYWKVGDRKEVVLNGTVGDKSFSNTTTYCYILGFDHNKSVESGGAHSLHIGFGASALSGGKYIAYCDSKYNHSASSTGYFSMNSSKTNSGGWNSCQMKSTICPAFKNALPSDLQSNIRAVTKWQNNGDSTTGQSSSNEIWLLSEMEIFGSAEYSNYTANQVQYDFYKGVTGWSAAPKIKYKDTSTATAVDWWERSALSSNSVGFCRVNTGGNALGTFAQSSLGFAPCLCL